MMKTYNWELVSWNLVPSLTTAVIVNCFVIGDELLLTSTRSITSSTSSSFAYIREKQTKMLQQHTNIIMFLTVYHSHIYHGLVLAIILQFITVYHSHIYHCPVLTYLADNPSHTLWIRWSQAPLQTYSDQAFTNTSSLLTWQVVERFNVFKTRH